MHRLFRALASATLIVTLIVSLASPVAAVGLGEDNGDHPNSVPVVVDVLILRPLGLLGTALGLALYAFPVAPITAITRPGDLGKPFGPLVMRPVRYTFMDPLGQH